MKLNSLEDLLEDQLRDIYSAELQISKSLPKLAKRVTSPRLREAFSAHLGETKGQIERLEEISKLIGVKLSGKICKGMEGLLSEGAEILEIDGKPDIIDAALIAAAQRVEHYEIAAYGVARAVAEELGFEEVVKLLQESLDQEAGADEVLSVISEEDLLPKSISRGLNGSSEAYVG